MQIRIILVIFTANQITSDISYSKFQDTILVDIDMLDLFKDNIPQMYKWVQISAVYFVVDNDDNLFTNLIRDIASRVLSNID